jgi:hypothetical protein
MTGKKYISVMVVVILMFQAQSAARDKENDAKSVFQASRINRPLQLTGRLDDPLWKQARPVSLDYEVEPGENTPAPQRTLALALYDNDNLYIGFRCYDTKPDQIRANLSDRDKMYQDDYVIILFDTYGDYHRAYELAVNPYGVQGDLMRTSNGEDESFDIIWKSAAARDDSGWTAEFAVPFKSLRFPNKDQQRWLIHIVRNYPRSSRIQTSWMPIDRNNPNVMGQGGLLEGLLGIESGGSIELLPYVMGQQTGNLVDYGDPSSGFHNDKTKGRIGGGIQYSPTPNLSFDAVINPDFSQIESDAEQISVNTTFALYYQEKRPFFLTGQELLQTPMYYSRSINNPLGAARIIGKTGSLSYMYLGAYDRNTPFDIPGEEESSTFSSNVKSYSNIGRMRYDFGDEDYMGAMFFMRNFSDAHNYVAGFDWSYKFWSNWYFSGETFLSNTKELNDPSLFESPRELGTTGHTAGFDGESYSGTGLHLALSRSARDYSFSFVFNDFTPAYQTYNGLFSLTDYRQLYMNHEYAFYPNNAFIDKGGIDVSSYMQFNHAGRKKEQVVQPVLFATFKGQTTVNLSYLLVNDERFRDKWFSGINRGSISVNSRPIDAISLAFQASIGKFIYRTYSPVMGIGHMFSTTINLNPTSRFNLAFSYDRARLLDYDTRILFYDGNIYRSTIIYQFTQEIFLRTILQYSTFGKSFNIYPLFSYKLNAFTTFFAGVTNDYYNYGGEHGFTTTDRQYFVKVQYLFRH